MHDSCRKLKCAVLEFDLQPTIRFASKEEVTRFNVRIDGFVATNFKWPIFGINKLCTEIIIPCISSLIYRFSR